MRKLFLSFLFCIFPMASYATNSPWVCPANLTGIGTTGNLSSTIIFSAPTTGWYDVKLTLLPASSTIAAVASPSFAYTSNGVSRTITLTSVSLVSIAVAPAPTFLPLYVDVGTTVTLAITAPSGSYNWRACWKPS